MKKLIVIVLLVSICSCFAFANYPVIDMSNLYEKILEKMATLSHFAEEIEQWKSVLDHYKKQYEQIKRYYQELKGISEKFKSGNLKDMWDSAKLCLNKLIEINNFKERIEEDTFKNLDKLMGQFNEISLYAETILTNSTLFDETKKALIAEYRESIDFINDSFSLVTRRTKKIIEERMQKKRETLEYFQKMVETAEQEYQTISQMIENTKVLADSIKEIANPIKEERKNALSMLNSFRSALLVVSSEAQDSLKSGTQTEAQRAEFQQAISAYNADIQIQESMLNQIEEKLNTLSNTQAQYESDIITFEYKAKEIEDTIKFYQSEIIRVEAVEI